MCKNEQTIHYCTILSAGQWDFLLDGKAAINRQKCLHRLMTAAVRTKTVLRIKGVEIALEVGQAAASDVELAEYLSCNRKTVGKLIDSFNRLGVLTTRTNNRTSIHTLHFLTGWYVGGVLLTNPHYVRPSANAKEQADGRRTPSFDEKFHRTGKVLCRITANAESRKRTPRKATQRPFLLPFVRLCSPTVLLTGRTARAMPTIPGIIDSGDVMPDGNHTESHNEPKTARLTVQTIPIQARKIDGTQRADFSGTPLSWRE